MFNCFIVHFTTVNLAFIASARYLIVDSEARYKPDRVGPIEED